MEVVRVPSVEGFASPKGSRIMPSTVPPLAGNREGGQVDDKRDDKEFDGDLAIDDSAAGQVTGGAAKPGESERESVLDFTKPGASKTSGRFKRFLKHRG